MVTLPKGLAAQFGPYIPDLRRIYWIDALLLDPNDPKPERPVVVVKVPSSTYGTVTMVTRSSTEKNGQWHSKHPMHGLAKEGWFTRLRVVSCELWTPESVRSSDLLLDDETFSYVCKDFDL